MLTTLNFCFQLYADIGACIIVAKYLETYRLEIHPLNTYDNALFLRKVTTLRTTLNIDDELLQQARSLTGFNEETALVHEGLKALIERESARRLAKLGGSQRQLESVTRRRIDDTE